ncbi:MAG TPA: DUF5687 family protein [Panacibacter sp.]|nr:DUF5687 family protein [Panacibacter sp.]
MIITLLRHQWKAFWRSRSAGKNVAMQIFMAFIVLYFLSAAIFAGLSLGAIIKQLFPGQDAVKIFCGFILYYFFVDMLIRFMWQELPTLSVQPYITQNIQRSQLSRFLNIRSLFTFLNLLPLVLFIPFAASEISAAYGVTASAALVTSIVSLTLFNHFIILFIKRKTIINGWWLVGFFLFIVLLMGAEYLKIISVSNFSSAVFLYLLQKPWLCIVTAIMALAAFYNNNKFLLKNLYIEELSAGSKEKQSAEYTWLQRFGLTGELIGLDLKLILRNKRPRSTAFLSVALLFYGFIFYKPEFIEKDMLGTLLIGGAFVTGIFIISYGQFLFAWQSNYFDGLMAANVSIKQYIKGKFILFLAVSTISFLLVSFYGFLSWKIIVLQVAAYSYNIGFNSVLSVYLATRSYKGLDLSKSASFNYQGTGATQWLAGLIFIFFGAVIYLPFSLLFNAWAGVLAIGLFGLINLLLQEWWIDKLTKEFSKRKYRILEGFREK